jgi:hypothetical protein
MASSNLTGKYGVDAYASTTKKEKVGADKYSVYILEVWCKGPPQELKIRV